jgi:hypothetical protein
MSTTEAVQQDEFGFETGAQVTSATEERPSEPPPATPQPPPPDQHYDPAQEEFGP